MRQVTTELFSPGTLNDQDLVYVVIGALKEGRWLFVRHRERTTWEMPAGHIEKGESPDRAAIRELYEEAGVTDSALEIVCDYRVTVNEISEGGRVYLATIHAMDPQGLEHETAEVIASEKLPADLTYPEVQTVLFHRLRDYVK